MGNHGDEKVSEKASNNPIHPTLSIYLSGQPFNSANASSNGDESNCCAYLKKLNKNKLQTSSVTGGYLQLLVSGMHIAWGIWRLDFTEPWFNGVNGSFIFTMLAFYVAATIGGILSGFIINIWRKQAIYYLSGSVMAVSSLIMIIWCYSEIGMLFGRLTAGLGHGLVYNIIVIHAGENSIKQIRGIITSTINCILWLSIFIGSLLIATVQMSGSTAISSDRMIGILGLAFSVFALMYTMFWTQESVVYLLSHGKLGEALELLTSLRHEETETISISDDFEEMRLMVNQDKKENKNIFSNNNAKPLGLMVAIKCLHVLTNNVLLNWIMMIITIKILPNGSQKMAPVVLTAARFLGSIFQTILADSLGRKFFLSISSTLSGITLLIVEILLISVVNFSQTTDGVLSAFCIIFQFCVSFGIDPMQHVILSEAFATSKKIWSIVFVITCENAAQMFLIGLCFIDGVIVETTYHLVLFISVTIILIIFLILAFCLPETRGFTLSETRDAFRNIQLSWCA